MGNLFGEYVQKPVTVQAACLKVENLEEISKWSGLYLRKYNMSGGKKLIYARTENGEEFRGEIGDWVVKAPNGVFKLVAVKVFRELFEPAELGHHNIEDIFNEDRDAWFKPGRLEFTPEPTYGPQGASGVSGTTFYPPYDN